MTQQTICAHAKINLTLDVTGKREDGYHFVSMVMQSVGLHDVVTVSAHTGSGDIVVATDQAALPNDRSNLCWRAAEQFFAQTGIVNDGVRVEVQKNIPVAAGMAGGSTDAAAVLFLLNRLYETGLSQQQLCDIGLQLGADVPFCLCGGTMLAEGIGEKLTRLPDAPSPIVLLCKPPVGVSTPEIYRALDDCEIVKHPDTAAMQQAIADRDTVRMAQLLENVMQPVTAQRRPEILKIRQTMLDGGAMGSIMSGSGPTVFGLFSEQKAAETVYHALKKTYLDTILTDFSVSGLTEPH